MDFGFALLKIGIFQIQFKLEFRQMHLGLQESRLQEDGW
jgi:hypothetical protein